MRESQKDRMKPLGGEGWGEGGQITGVEAVENLWEILIKNLNIFLFFGDTVI